MESSDSSSGYITCLMSDSDVVAAFRSSIGDVNSTTTSCYSPFSCQTPTFESYPSPLIPCRKLATRSDLELSADDSVDNDRRGSGASRTTVEEEEEGSSGGITPKTTEGTNMAYLSYHGGTFPEQRYTHYGQALESAAARVVSIARFKSKRSRRVWTKRVDYAVRHSFAVARPRVNGRFVSKDYAAAITNSSSSSSTTLFAVDEATD